MRNVALFMTFMIIAFVHAQTDELRYANQQLIRKAGSSKIDKARAYYYSSDYGLAEAYFFEALDADQLTPNDFMLFANTLVHNEKHGLAKEFYTEYGMSRADDRIDLDLKQAMEGSTFVLSPTNAANPDIQNPTYQSRSFTALYNGYLTIFDPDCDGNLTRRSSLPIIPGLNYHAVHLFEQGNAAISSVSDPATGEMRLYHIYKKKGEWKKFIKLFEDQPGNFAFPFFDEEKQVLYFSSDRNGGKGGYDLYMSIYNDGRFGSPINLAQVNTPGHEIYPRVQKNTLMFSSNGRISMGGFDLYKFDQINEYNSFVSPVNTVNSAYDDLLFIPNGPNTFYMFRGADDSLFLDHFDRPVDVRYIGGEVIDNEGKAVSGAHVLIETARDKGVFTTTNAQGDFQFMDRGWNKETRIKVVASGFKPLKARLHDSIYILTPVEPEVVVKEVEKIVYKNIIRSDSMTPVVDPDQDSSVAIENTGIPLSDAYYIIVGSFYSYTSAYDVWSKWIDVYDRLEILEFDHGLYRVAYFAGENEEDAMEEFNQAKIHKNDLWILRP